MLPQPRLLSAREDHPSEPPNPPEWPLMPLNALEPPPQLLWFDQELEPEERSLLKLCEFALLIFTVFPLTFRLYVFPLFRL